MNICSVHFPSLLVWCEVAVIPNNFRELARYAEKTKYTTVPYSLRSATELHYTTQCYKQTRMKVVEVRNRLGTTLVPA